VSVKAASLLVKVGRALDVSACPLSGSPLLVFLLSYFICYKPFSLVFCPISSALPTVPLLPVSVRHSSLSVHCHHSSCPTTDSSFCFCTLFPSPLLFPVMVCIQAPDVTFRLHSVTFPGLSTYS
jgi:hypothetical protein